MPYAAGNGFDSNARTTGFTLRARVLACCLAALTPLAAVRAGGDPNACDIPTEDPDVIVGDLHEKNRYGTVGGITGFSVGTVSCNEGSCWLNWMTGGSNQHPVIGQNMYRLKDGRFEHIGQSWLKHGFFAVSQELCSEGCIDTDGTHLGVNCSDPYSAFFNGKQNEMGPKFEVNPWTGVHPHPVTDQSQTGNAIYKRLQVYNADLNPSLNADARYFVEGQYVTQDDSAAGMQHNNASHREVEVSGSGTSFDITLIGTTRRGEPAILAWPKIQPGVVIEEVHPPSDGKFILGAAATPVGGGMWRYEYAVHNLNSHRAARSFSVPVPAGATVSNIGFHDVDYHSGEPFAGTNWAHNGGTGGAVTWSTSDFATDPNANALRWGTLYNFRFDANVAPATHEVTLGLFRPGVLAAVQVSILTPDLCDDDGTCDPGENCENCPEDCASGACEPGENGCNCAADCGAPPEEEAACGNGVDDDCDGFQDCGDSDCCDDAGCSLPDGDGDGYYGCGDCDGGDGFVWAIPGEVGGALMEKVDVVKSVLHWSPLAEIGGESVLYEMIRSDEAADFWTNPRCFAETAGTTSLDPQVPDPGAVYFYLVRGKNDCPGGLGPMGQSSSGVPRVSPSCP
jgi:hypothetical protein